MKKILFCLLAALTFAVPVFAVDSFVVDSIKYGFDEKGDGCVVIGSTKTGDLVIPSVVTYRGCEYPVKVIGKGALKGCIDLTSITIPGSVQRIEESPFEGCTGLTILTFDAPPLNLRCYDNGNSLVAGCTNLKLIKLNGQIQIRHDTFIIAERKEGSKSKIIAPKIEIPRDAVGYMVGNSFWSHYKFLVDGEPLSVKEYIGKNLAYRLVKGKDIREAIVVFPSNMVLAETRIAPGLKKVRVLQVQGNFVIPSIVIDRADPDKSYNVTAIGKFAFYDKRNIRSITIPNTVTSIGINAFRDCHRLKSISIPNSVTLIGDCAFSTCKALTTLTIPGPVTGIGSSLFYSCSDLKTIKITNRINSSVKQELVRQVEEINKDKKKPVRIVEI